MTKSACQRLKQTTFFTSVAQLNQLDFDPLGCVAILGRSNSGKSTLINTICQQKRLAKTSQRPGATQLINYFHLGNNQYLVDFPGYGFARLSEQKKIKISRLIQGYFLSSQQPIYGIIICMDIRHPLKPKDMDLILWEPILSIPKCLVLTKSDKLSKNKQMQTLHQVQNTFQRQANISVLLSPAQSPIGHPPLAEQIVHWLDQA